MNKSKSKKRSVFNIIDIIIVALLAIFLAYFIYTYVMGNSLNNIGATEVEIEYTLRIENVRGAHNKNIKEGHTVKTSDGNIFLGNVLSVNREFSESGSGYVLYVTVRSDAYMRKNSSINISGQKLVENMEIPLCFPNYFASSAVITEIKVV
jgi:hypothetical protein